MSSEMLHKFPSLFNKNFDCKILIWQCWDICLVCTRVQCGSVTSKERARNIDLLCWTFSFVKDHREKTLLAEVRREKTTIVVTSTIFRIRTVTVYKIKSLFCDFVTMSMRKVGRNGLHYLSKHGFFHVHSDPSFLQRCDLRSLSTLVSFNLLFLLDSFQTLSLHWSLVIVILSNVVIVIITFSYDRDL